MSIYITIYNNLCKKGKLLKEHYKPKSNIHAHHIIPKHSGGADDANNLTYLTIRQHIIAHFLLWKIYKNFNDLRSMKMLGAKLNYKQRSIIGKKCRENKIGYFNDKYQKDPNWHKNRTDKSTATQRKNKVGAFFDPTLRKEICSKGGKAAAISQKMNKTGAFQNPELQKKIASLGGKSLKGLICVTNGKHRTRIKPHLLKEYESIGYKRGFTLFS